MSEETQEKFTEMGEWYPQETSEKQENERGTQQEEEHTTIYQILIISIIFSEEYKC